MRRKYLTHKDAADDRKVNARDRLYALALGDGYLKHILVRTEELVRFVLYRVELIVES